MFDPPPGGVRQHLQEVERLFTLLPQIKNVRKESKSTVENYSKESYVGNYGNINITNAYFGVGMKTLFSAKVHSATLAGRNTVTVANAPFNKIVDGSLQLPFNHAHARIFTTDLQIVHV
ncbi:hypothetical protein TNCV_1127511 [Trichonephila clavipes]|nr:hypothetical protein TNCV_1127511 [Trichonephila clavipes]